MPHDPHDRQELLDRIEQLQQQLAAAERASMQKSRFLANMSHELRTPISGIIGMVELLKDGALSSRQSDHVEAIASTSESFLELVNQLLDYSKAEADAIEIESREYDLWTESESIVQMLHVQAGEKDVDVVLHLDPNLPRHVLGDRLRARQVVLNLVANAVKFTARGVVSLHVSKVVGPDGSEWIEWVVDDTGCGFDETTANRLFEPFVQAEVSTSRRFGGTGLGLTISRRLVERMNGHIAFASAPDSGSTFTIRLPLVLSRKVAANGQTKKTARLIAMRSSTLRTVAEHLPSLGYEVVHEDLCDRPADLLVFESACDTSLALASVRDRYPEVPILVIESPGAHVPEERFASLGIVASLQQPVRPTQLLSLLDPDRAPAQSDASEDEGTRFEGMRVLVVDDSPVNLLAMSARLQGMGCEVDEATDGAQCVDACKQKAYDAVFLDCQMPGVSGYEAAVMIREYERLEGIDGVVIVALTADVDRANEQRCADSGMNDFCGKPMRTATIESVLRRVKSGSYPAASVAD